MDNYLYLIDQIHLMDEIKNLTEAGFESDDGSIDFLKIFETFKKWAKAILTGLFNLVVNSLKLLASQFNIFKNNRDYHSDRAANTKYQEDNKDKKQLHLYFRTVDEVNTIASINNSRFTIDQMAGTLNSYYNILDESLNKMGNDDYSAIDTSIYNQAIQLTASLNDFQSETQQFASDIKRYQKKKVILKSEEITVLSEALQNQNQKISALMTGYLDTNDTQFRYNKSRIDKLNKCISSLDKKRGSDQDKIQLVETFRSVINMLSNVITKHSSICKDIVSYYSDLISMIRSDNIALLGVL